MARGTKNKDYRHPGEETVQRPEIGLEPHVMKRDHTKKPDQTYHSKPSLANESSKEVDSSIPPEFTWNEDPNRDFAEFLIELAFRGASGESDVFPAEWEWSKTRVERITSLSDARDRLKSLSGAFLRWSGKVKQRDVKIQIPTPPLFIHERHSANAILNVMREKSAAPVTGDLFGDDGLDLAQRIDAYEHKGNWENRLILGDSLHVMNSLLVREKESLGRQVQMIYFDPPYGVNFGSNFQPFVKEPSVEDNQDKSMTREPEMVTAFRDTWELGLHSYLTYIRDRLMLARDLLADSGSIFVQISEANVHRVRQVMDEVFGAENFVSQIWFQTTTQSTSALLSRTGDFILWYGKSKDAIHYNQLYLSKPTDITKLSEKIASITYVLLKNGKHRRPTREEFNGVPIPKGSRLYQIGSTVSKGAPSSPQPVEFNGRTYHPLSGNQWRFKYPEGMDNLVKAGRIVAVGDRLYFSVFHDEFPYQELTSNWTGTHRTTSKLYACQTSDRVVERCIQMTTEPGDLVLDITCGSGVTPVAAEKWGRRWIGVDISRVPITIARQRLMTQVFDWIELKDDKVGPSGGFVYKSKDDGGRGGVVKKVTPRSISRKEDPPDECIVDLPEIVRGVQRVCGPFTVESTIQPAASLDLLDNGDVAEILGRLAPENQDHEDHIDHMTDVLHQVGNMTKAGEPEVKIKEVARIDGCEFLHSKCVCVEGGGGRIQHGNRLRPKGFRYPSKPCARGSNGGNAERLSAVLHGWVWFRCHGPDRSGEDGHPDKVRGNCIRHDNGRLVEEVQEKRDFHDHWRARHHA